MFGAAVLIPATDSGRYSIVISDDPDEIEAAQRLRYQTFAEELGAALPQAIRGPRTGEMIDTDRFDAYSDHLLARDEQTGAIVGCYRLLPPDGARAAGGIFTDTNFENGSYTENAEGYFLTTRMMQWFWAHYVGDHANAHPEAAVLQHADLSGLPPATVLVAQYDPLRDEGLDYAEIAQVAAQLKAGRSRRNKVLAVIGVVGLVIVGLSATWVSTKNEQAASATADKGKVCFIYLSFFIL